ncbi:MAG: hypothetical protein JO180_12375 [Gemmatirosa sp.]|nr:hypothetical protein [Gemmatirosa sp.]
MQTVTLKIRRQGDSLGIALPKAMTDALDLREGDEVHGTQTTDGIVVRPHDELFARAVEAEPWMSRRYRNALKTRAARSVLRQILLQLPRRYLRHVVAPLLPLGRHVVLRDVVA